MSLFQFFEYQRGLLSPFTAWTKNSAKTLDNPDSLLAQVPGASSFGAAYEILYRLGDTWEKPASLSLQSSVTTMSFLWSKR
ncbi:hypothetical protein AU476_21675 [Cupriavidus sp. UYMSc13B]|nr:hypothetical protein AU476_21675 [Cupriavidus sp. UYMSc13B]